MIHDALLELSDSQAVTVSAESTNAIDQLAAGQPIGKECYWLEIRVAEAVMADDDATVTFSLETDDAEDFNTKTILVASGPMRKPDLNINVIAWRVRVPAGVKQFLRVYYTVADGPLTAGKFDTYFVLDTQTDDTLRAATPWGPLDLGPTAGFATHRMPGMACTHIMKVRRVNAGDEVDVYDFQQNTSNYKLSSGGAWIDGSGEAFYVKYWYDQTGNGRYLGFDYGSWSQPELLLNNNNGRPVIEYTQYMTSFRCITSSVSGTDVKDYINADMGNVITYSSFFGSSAAFDVLQQGPMVIGTAQCRYGMHRGIWPVGGDDRIWIYNYDVNYDFVSLVYSVDTWYVIANSHQNGEVRGFLDGQPQAAVASGDTDFGEPDHLRSGESSYPSSNTRQEMLLTFDIVLSDDDHLDISNYCKTH